MHLQIMQFYALVAAALDAAITFKLADWTQPLCEEFFGLEGVSFPTSNSVCWAPVAWLLDKLWNVIPGINKLHADPQTISKKFGIFGEPLFVGVVLGALIALLAGAPIKEIFKCCNVYCCYNGINSEDDASIDGRINPICRCCQINFK